MRSEPESIEKSSPGGSVAAIATDEKTIATKSNQNIRIMMTRRDHHYNQRIASELKKKKKKKFSELKREMRISSINERTSRLIVYSPEKAKDEDRGREDEEEKEEEDDDDDDG